MAGAAPAVAEAARRRKPIYEATRHDVAITVPKDRPQGTVVLRGARILTMKGNEVIAKGDIVVKDNRIVAVGPQGKVTIPSGAKDDRRLRQDDPAGLRGRPRAHLAGVRHPSLAAVGVSDQSRLRRDDDARSADVDDRRALVQRTWSRRASSSARAFSRPGPGVFQQTNIRTIDEARDVLKKYSEFYNTETIKQYMAGDRRTRQLIIMAAREQHLMPTLEGGLDFKKNLTEAMDGYVGIEHTMPIAPIYKDVTTLLAESGTTWTPTLIVQYGGPWAENYWYENSDVVNDPKLRRFTPRDEVERKTRAAAGLVGAVAVVVPALRRAGGEGRRGRRPRRHGQPRPAAGPRRAVGDLEHRVGRHAEVRRASRRDDLRRRGDRP